MIQKVKRFLVVILIKIIYHWGCIWYDKQYLVGRHFDRKHFSKGWGWILKYWFGQKVMKKNAEVPFPIPPYVLVANPKNVIFDPDDMQNFHTVGTYFQALGGQIIIGKGTYVAAGVGIITANHDLNDLSRNIAGGDTIIGRNSWIGMNAVILPGVCLGEHTIVGAGAIVTKSFPEGNCVIAGNPAKIIRTI